MTDMPDPPARAPLTPIADAVEWQWQQAQREIARLRAELAELRDCGSGAPTPSCTAEAQLRAAGGGRPNPRSAPE